jgi:hypothetical protein
MDDIFESKSVKDYLYMKEILHKLLLNNTSKKIVAYYNLTDTDIETLFHIDKIQKNKIKLKTKYKKII